jgi:hypothetical protein
MLQLILAYLFAAGTTVTVVYLARQNRKQGWQRPAPQWFGVELQTREAAMTEPLADESESGDLMPQLRQLNRALAAHGNPIQPRGESAVESPETPELVSIRRV